MHVIAKKLRIHLRDGILFAFHYLSVLHRKIRTEAAVRDSLQSANFLKEKIRNKLIFSFLRCCELLRLRILARCSRKRQGHSFDMNIIGIVIRISFNKRFATSELVRRETSWRREGVNLLFVVYLRKGCTCTWQNED